jgi:predicted dehydrogenase
VLGIAFQSGDTAEFGYLAAERDAGRLGKIQVLSGWATQEWLKVTTGKWRQDPDVAGGGMMYDTGAHLINALLWLADQPVTEVACFADNAGSPVDINGVAILRFAGGAMGSITIGGNCPWRNEIQVQTDRYLIITDQYGSKLEMLGCDNRRVYPKVATADAPAAGTSHRNFVDAILGRESVRVPPRYGVALATVMDALYESARTSSVVRVKEVPATPG